MEFMIKVMHVLRVFKVANFIFFLQPLVCEVLFSQVISIRNGWEFYREAKFVMPLMFGYKF